MNIVLTLNRPLLLIVFLELITNISYAQNELVVSQYDTSLTAMYLTSSLDSCYYSFNQDTSNIEVLLLQNVRKREIKSLRVRIHKKKIELTVFGKETNSSFLDSNKYIHLINILSKIGQSIEVREITDQKLSEYYIFFIFRMNGKVYHLKTSNYLFFHHNNEYLNLIKEFIKALGVNYSKLIHEFVDG